MTTAPQGMMGPQGQLPPTPTLDQAVVATSPHPAALNLARNIQALHDSGYAHLDVPTQVAISSHGGGVLPTLQLGKTMDAGISSLPPAIHHIFEDPQLQRTPSLTQSLSYWMHNSLGSIPVVEPHVKDLQTSLIAGGDAPGMVADGQWTSEWTNLLNNAGQKQLSKPGAGNIDPMTVFHGIMKTPSELDNVVWGMIKSMPRSFMHLAGTLVSAGADLATTNPLTVLSQGENHSTIGAQWGQNIANLGSKTQQTPTEFRNQGSTWGSMAQDIGTMLTVVPLLRLATGSGEAIGAAVSKGALKIQPFEDVAPKFNILRAVQANVEAGNSSFLTRYSLPNLVDKFPATAYMYRGVEYTTPQVVDAAIGRGLSKAVGVQMAIRNTLAQRLRLPAVQAANSIMNRGMITGLAGTAIAGAESKTGAIDSPLDSTVYNVHPIAGRLANWLNIIGMQANPGASKEAIAPYIKDVQSFHAATKQAFDETGVLTAWENANKDYLKANKTSLPELYGKYGTGAMNDHINAQLNDVILNHAVETELAPQIANINSPYNLADSLGKVQMRDDIAHAILQDATNGGSKFAQARESLTLRGGHPGLGNPQNDLETGFKALQVKMMGNTDAAHMASKGVSHLDALIQGDAIGQKLFHPDIAQYLWHPGLDAEYGAGKTSLISNPDITKSDPWTTNPVAAKPLAPNPNDLKPLTQEQRSRLMVLMRGQGMNDRSKALSYVSGIVGRPVASRNELNQQEARSVINKLLENAPKGSDNNFVEFDGKPIQRGQFGIANATKITQKPALQIANKFQEQLDAATTVAEQNAVKKDIATHLLNDYGVDTREVFNKTPQDLLNVLFDHANKLAVDIRPVAGAPKEVWDYIKQLEDLGKKPVVGTDIGHRFVPEMLQADLGELPSKLKATINKTIAGVGLSPHTTSSAELSARYVQEAFLSGQKQIDSVSGDPKYFLAPGMNMPRLWSYINEGLKGNPADGLAGTQKLRPTQRATLALAKGAKLYDGVIKQMVADSQGSLTPEQAWANILGDKRTAITVRNASKKALLDSMLRPLSPDSAQVLGLPEGSAIMNKAMAGKILRGIYTAQAGIPHYMVGGLGRIEPILYSNFGLAGREIPFTNARTVPNVMAPLLAMRNRFRYETSPLFAFRRITKTMAKGATEGVPPAVMPGKTMRDTGVYDTFKSDYISAFPKEASRLQMTEDTNQLIDHADLWNLYNPTEQAMWMHGNILQELLSDPTKYTVENGVKVLTPAAKIESAKRLENVMGYADQTAAERSLNAVFFPFSFNKTLMRQFGTFLLTHPGQRMVLNAANQTYDNHAGGNTRAWLEANASIIKQFESLNALEHGVGLGMSGGINYPYFAGIAQGGVNTANLFHIMTSPKKITYGTPAQNQSQLTTLGQYLPMIKTLNDLLVKDGGQIQNTGKGLFNYFSTLGDSDVNPIPQNNMPAKAQITQAWDYRSRIIAAFAPVLAHNYRNTSNPMKWGTLAPPETNLANQPINKMTIGEFVHYRYPAFNPTLGSSISMMKKIEADQFIGKVKVKDAALGEIYQTIQDTVVSFTDQVNKDSMVPAKVVGITDAFRSLAIELSLRDPNFYNFYKTHYQSVFGPLEAFKP